MPRVVAALLCLVVAAGVRASEETDQMRKELEAMKQSQAELLDMLKKQSDRMAELEKRLAGAPTPTPAPTPGTDRPAEPPMKWNEFMVAGSKVKFYGFIRADMIWDDSRPSNTQTIAFIRSEDPTAPASIGAPQDAEDFTVHPRLTRFGFDLDGPTINSLNDAKVKGKIEVDFYNNGLAGQAESREALRMRHGYLTLGWTDLTLLFGQTSDVISPIWPIVNADLVMWGAGNLGDRRPQFRFDWQPALGPGKAVAQGEVGLSGADDNQDIDPAGTTGAGYRDGETSGLPTFQGRLAYKMPIGEKKQNLELGVWGHRAWEEPDAAFNGKSRFDSWAVGGDIQVPLWADRLWFKGEVWTGENLDDVRGGIFQGVNTVTGSEVGSDGGFAELGLKICDWYTVSPGYSRDDPWNEDLNPGGRINNRIFYVANRLNFNPVEIGFDYFNWRTEFDGFENGDDNRFQLYVMYKF